MGMKKVKNFVFIFHYLHFSIFCGRNNPHYPIETFKQSNCDQPNDMRPKKNNNVNPQYNKRLWRPY